LVERERDGREQEEERLPAPATAVDKSSACTFCFGGCRLSQKAVAGLRRCSLEAIASPLSMILDCPNVLEQKKGEEKAHLAGSIRVESLVFSLEDDDENWADTNFIFLLLSISFFLSLYFSSTLLPRSLFPKPIADTRAPSTSTCPTERECSTLECRAAASESTT